MWLYFVEHSHPAGVLQYAETQVGTQRAVRGSGAVPSNNNVMKNIL